jgi:hypothetical protein
MAGASREAAVRRGKGPARLREQTGPCKDDGVSEQPGRYARTFAGLAGAMIVLLAAVLAFVGFRALVRGDVPDPAPAVDYATPLRYARAEAGLDVLAPDPLPDGWRATSARARSEGDVATWHLGLVTAAGSYAAVEQSDGERREFVDRFADGATPAGSSTVEGTTWRRLEGGSPEERALVRTERGVTTMVAGSASWAELEELAATLRAG